MPKQQTIDLPKLPSFDVSNASSSITDQFVYGDRTLMKLKPKQHHLKDPFNMEFSRSSLQNVIHIITAELKAKGSRTPFMFLPFRQEDDEYKLKQFLLRIINESEFIEDKLLETVVKRTDEYTLISSLKFFWCRLPASAIIGWKSYNKFAKLEKEKGYPKKAFLTIMPYCLSSASHASIVYDFLDLLVSIASYSKDNKLSGRKICKMCGVWAFNGSPTKSGNGKKPSFAKGLNDWIPASDALFHVMLSFLRSILPEDETNQKQLPKTLQLLISSNSYPPPQTKHSDPSAFLEVPIITLGVNSPSRTPLELIYKIGNTLTFDNAKMFHSRDDYILLKSLFKDSDQLISRLSSENRKLIDRMSSSNTADLIVDEEFMKFKLAPGWSDELLSFDNQEKILDSQHFYTANVSKTLIDDYFIWTWLSTMGPEETNQKRKLFGKTFILEVELSESYKKWVIIEEQDINGEFSEVPDINNDIDIDIKLEKLRRQELLLLEQKLKKKKANQDVQELPPPAPISKEIPLPPVPPTKGKKLKRLDESSKKISGKLASSLRKFSNSEKRQLLESKPLPTPIPELRDNFQMPRDKSEHNFKLPEFEDDTDGLADDLELYLKTSTFSETKPLNVRSRTPSPKRNTEQYMSSPEPRNSPQRQSPQQYQYFDQQQSHRQQMVSVYGLEQLQQYSPYINYEDGTFPSLSPQQSTFNEFDSQEKRLSRSPQFHQQQFERSPERHQSPHRQEPNSPLHQQLNSPEVPNGSAQYDQHQQLEQQLDNRSQEPSIPSNQTSGTSSRLKRKPPPVILDRPQSEYSDNPITPSNSQPLLRPLSQYSNNSYANSFAPPTPQHQLLDPERQHISPEKQQVNEQYQYRSMIPSQSPTRQQDIHSSHSPSRLSQNGAPINYQYKSMLSPVKNEVQEKPLPPDPSQSVSAHGTPISYHQYSAHSSPVKSITQSPTRSMNEQISMYDSAHTSPYKLNMSPMGSPNRVETDYEAHEDKSLPLSPIKPFTSAQPSASLYGSSASPSKVSLYGESVPDLIEDAKRDSTYHSMNSASGTLLKLSPSSKPTRASAIIENFDLLENELQDFLNEDSKSFETQESFKTGIDDSGMRTRPTSQNPPIVNSQQERDIDTQKYQAVPQLNYGPPEGAFPQPSISEQLPVPNGQQYYQPQGHKANVQQSHRHQSPNATANIPVDPQYPVSNSHYSPNPSNSSLPYEGLPYGYELRQDLQSYPQPYPQQMQHAPGPQGAYPRKHVQQHGPQQRVSPNNSYDQLQVPHNGYPAHQQQMKDYPAQPRVNGHSPARPSNLGPNYHHPPRQQQQQQQQYGVTPQYYGPPPVGLPVPPQNYPPGPVASPPQRGRQQYLPGPYLLAPQQFQHYPGTPPKQQYYQQQHGSPRHDQYQQQGQRTPHSGSPASFGVVPSPQKMYNSGGMSPNPRQQTRSDYTIQHMPPAQKVNRLHGHTLDKSTRKNLRDAIVTGGFGI